MAHHSGEFLVAYFAVAVKVGFADHLVNFLLAQILAERLHDLKVTKKNRMFRGLEAFPKI